MGDGFDKDGSGTISKEELVPILQTLDQSQTDNKILELVMNSDLNGDSIIDFSEFFENMTKKSSEPDQMKNLKDAFEIFDSNKNGFIEPNEMEALSKTLDISLSNEDSEKFWKEGDVSGDGTLDYEEFIKIMSK